MYKKKDNASTVIYENYMKQCINISEEGVQSSMPNPSVGALIVHDSKIIGKGFTSPYGGHHAEVNAINSVTHKSLLRESTLYVTLEPCSHFGKTPPCVDKIISMGIPKVVIGAIDPNFLVNGNGIKKLRDNGIQVVKGILEEECKKVNKRFFTFHELKRPYIILKWVQTKDGFIDKYRPNNEKGIEWISSKLTQKLTHSWRSQEAAICVGSNTIRVDNPLLTVRAIDGKNPLRIVLDKDLKLPRYLNIFNDQAKTIVFNNVKNVEENHLSYKKIDFDDFTQNFLLELYKMNVLSIMIEGGKILLTKFLQEHLWDEVRVIIGNKEFKEGIIAPQINAKYKESYNGSDKIKIYAKNGQLI